MPSSVLEKALLLYARRFPIRRGKLRLINLLSEASASSESTKRLTTLKYGGFKMSCDLAEMLQRQFYYFGTYLVEEEIIDCWQFAAKGARTIFDVGANAGIYSLAALAVQPEATVHAFEPTPEIANRLRATTKLNALDSLHVHEVAVSSQLGTATLNRFRGELGTNEGMNFISDTQIAPEGETVQTVCLDQFCRDNSIEKIDLLKIDVQGHEYAVLRGAEQLIRREGIRTIFMELNWAHSSGFTCPATHSVQFLKQSDYLFSKPGRYLNWKPAGDWLRSITDVVARREMY
jgi:FkbM family methyltransferase